MDKIAVGGILELRGLTMISILGISNSPGSAGQYLMSLGDAKINLHFIAETEDKNGHANVTVCVDRDRSAESLDLINKVVNSDRSVTVLSQPDVAVFTVYGPHFREKPAICSRLCSSLGDSKVNILGISSSVSSVCCIVDNSEYDLAYDSLLSVFSLP